MTAASLGATIVVPCYNEAARLDAEAFLGLLAADPAMSLLFVNDGSRDDTLDRLEQLRARAMGRLTVRDLGRNHGKAEAVRQGLVAALQAPGDIVGYLDADLATPLAEARRLIEMLRHHAATQVLIAARVSLLGREIRRSHARHYLGRLFASAASVTLGLPVYDTQCGAKFFRRGPALEHALAEPFLSRWAFDVELLGRLVAGGPTAPALGPGDIVEEPLRTWIDVPGSKLRPRQMIGAAFDLARISRDLKQRRRRAIGGEAHRSG